MDVLILLAGFLGAWLLVAGPLYQGSIELLEREIDSDGIEAVVAGVARGPAPSRWWWLLPPVMIALRLRRSERFRNDVVARLSPLQRHQYAGFLRTVSGWFVVAAGGTLIAVKETWELVEHLEWPVGAFVALVIGMLALSGSFTLVQRRRILAERDGAAP